MVFERTGEKFYATFLQKLSKPGFCLPAPGSFSQPAQALVEDCQVLVGLLHSATEKRGQRWVKSRQEKSKGAKKRQNWWGTALDQVVRSIPYFPIWPSVTNRRRQKEGQRATEKANSIVGREVWGTCRLSGMHSVLEVGNGRMVYSVVLVCFQSAGNVKASKPLSR